MSKFTDPLIMNSGNNLSISLVIRYGKKSQTCLFKVEDKISDIFLRIVEKKYFGFTRMEELGRSVLIESEGNTFPFKSEKTIREVKLQN
jgi:hypothetical protein